MLLTGRVRRREGADRGNGSPGDHSRPFLLGLPPGAPAAARFPLALGTNAAWAVRSEGPAALKPGHTFHTPGKHHRRRFSAPSRRPPTRRPFAWCLQLRALRPHRPHQAGPQGSPQLSCTLALPSLPFLLLPSFVHQAPFSAPRERTMPLGWGQGGFIYFQDCVLLVCMCFRSSLMPSNCCSE